MRRKPTIGLLTPFFGGNYLGEVIQALQQAVQSNEARLIVIRTVGKPYDHPIAMEQVDGWIILNNAVPDPYIRELESTHNKPIVTIAKDLNGLSDNGQMVVCDNEGAITQAVKHLYEHGHRRIGFIGHIDLDDMTLRLSGYKKAMEQLELEYNDDFILDPGEHSVLGGRYAAQKLSDANMPLEAAVVCTDMLALGMIERFNELGYHVPNDIALIGFDNTYTAQLSTPSITSIDQNITLTGTKAVELLLGQMEQRPNAGNLHKIPCTLAVRKSCGCGDAYHSDTSQDQASEVVLTEQKPMTELNVIYEFNKFILNHPINQLKDVAWALSRFFHWGCLGQWNTKASPYGLEITDWHHFQRDENLMAAWAASGSLEVETTNFPPYHWTSGRLAEEECELQYIIPYRTSANNWSLLAVGTTLSNTLNNLNDDMTAIHYLDQIAITLDRQALIEELTFLAYHDTLTGLVNRRRFYEDIVEAAASSDQKFAIIMMDLDNFKKVNDSYGHQMGDRLLQLVAALLKELAIQPNHQIARFGGDEFVILYPCEDVKEIEQLGNSISAYLSRLVLDERINFTITMSAGISLFPRDGSDPDTLIKKADIALYKAKQTGKNKFEIFSPHMIEETMWRINTEIELKDALAKEQFVLHYQPQVHLDTGELYGFEALLRWDSPEQGLLPPLAFIPLAEETGLIHPIGDWVLTEACKQSVKWKKIGYGPFKISVNLSGQQLKQPDFVKRVKQIVRRTGADPRYLCIEITESTVIDDLESTIVMLKEFKKLGIEIAMDDFGTGYSSLSMLKKLPIHNLKIDRTFIRDMTSELQDFDIIKAIISISKSLNLNIVAEGVEQKEQYDLLKELGCHSIQGYYFSRPLPASQVEDMLRVRSGN